MPLLRTRNGPSSCAAPYATDEQPGPVKGYVNVNVIMIILIIIYIYIHTHIEYLYYSLYFDRHRCSFKCSYGGQL